MSAQVSDKIQYGGKDYSISAIENPGEFFDIRELGLNPTANCTACWRGYVAIFGVNKENCLVLVELHTNNGDEPAPEINGVKPEVQSIDFDENDALDNISEYTLFGGELQYFNVNLPIRYSGKLTATAGFIRERYVHMGFHAPSSYRTAVEFTFEDGILVSENDISDRAAKKRAETDETRHRGGYGGEWIGQTFDLSYKSKWE